MPVNDHKGGWALALTLTIAACSPIATYAAAIARVHFAVGNVTAVGPDGRSRALAKDSQIQVGDTVNTEHGRAQLRFEDGAYMSLQPETALRVERPAEDGPASDVVIHLLRGGMRTITGSAGAHNKRSNHKLRTEVATIAASAAEYSVLYTSSIKLFCAGGVVSVENDGGKLVLGAGQGGFVQSRTQEPQRSAEAPFLPPMSASHTPEAQDVIASPVNALQESLGPVAILTGTFSGNWAIETAGAFGAFSEVNREVSLGTNGALESFVSIPGGSATLGSATATSSGNDGVIAWGRWTNGVTGGSSVDFSGVDLALDPLHYVVGLPVTAMPTTGSATYSMIGATTPSFTGIVTGATLLDSTIRVDFLAATASYNFRMSVDWQQGNTIVRTQAGGMPINFQQANGALSGNAILLQTGAPLALAEVVVQGFLSGPGAVRAGMVYDLFVAHVTGAGFIGGAVAHTRTGP